MIDSPLVKLRVHSTDIIPLPLVSDKRARTIKETEAFPFVSIIDDRSDYADQVIYSLSEQAKRQFTKLR